MSTSEYKLDAGWTGGGSPFHLGEREVQRRLGVSGIEDWARRVVREFMPDQHRDFHTALPFMVAGALDAQGRPWATLLTGPEDFIRSPDDRSLVMEGLNLQGDPLAESLRPGAHLGLLGIELATRRRNRVNGRVQNRADDRLVFEVDQAFGNCPQYISERVWTRVAGALGTTAQVSDRLTLAQRDWLTAADTFFIASGYMGERDSPVHGMDVSHRGGEPGFVEVLDDTHLRFPDYAGNNHFNTLGNIVLDPCVGLLFVDFRTGSLLHLTGRANIDWDSDAVARIPGARRIVEFEVDEIRERAAAVPLRWEASSESARSLKLVEKTQESSEITSFVFESCQGGTLPAFDAGQYLPIELQVPGIDGAVRRTYSLSGPPSTTRYRISVKREPLGLASRYLHDELSVGSSIRAGRPAGEDLMLPCDQCPIALISAGVGITPMLSLLHELVEEDGERPVWFIHGARNGTHHAFASEVKELAGRRGNVHAHFSYSRPDASDRLGFEFDRVGRVDGQLVNQLVTAPDAHYLLCGPPALMAVVQSELELTGVSMDRVHLESFGPKG